MKLTNLIILTLVCGLCAQKLTPPATNIVKNDSNVNIVKSDSTVKEAEMPIPDSLVIPALDFRSADIRDVFRGIASKYNVNIWISPEVQGVIPVHLTNIKVKDAIKFIVDHYGFKYRVRNGIIEVYKPVEVKVEAPKPPLNITLTGDKISIDLKDADIDSVVRKYSTLTGINVVIDKSVKGTLSGYLTNLDRRNGLRILFESNGFEVKESNEIFTISAMKIMEPGKGGADMYAGGGGGGGRFSVRVTNGIVRFEVNNGDLKQIISEIANQSGINIFIYGELKGRVSARVDSVGVETAFQFLLENTPYTFWRNNNVYFIGDESIRKVANAEFVALKYIKAEDLSEVLPKGILEKAVIKVIKGQNGVMVIGPYDVITATKEYVAMIDKPIAQILIEALVVDFSLNKMYEVGFKMFTHNPRDSSTFNETFFPSVLAQASGDGINRSLSKVMDFFSINQIIRLPSDFRAQIGLMENMGVLDVQSTPQIATLNGHTATIKITNKQYVLLTSETDVPGAGTSTSSIVRTSERLESYESNVSLSVTPWVTNAREVTVEVKPIFQIPGTSPQPGKIPPPINSREISSTVRLKDGETYVLGGLISTNVNETRESVPVLGKIPVLGWLFSYRSKKTVKDKLMIFLTPHVYYGSEGAIDKEETLKDWSKER